MSDRALRLGRFDWASYAAFLSYSVCSLSIPLVLVAMGNELAFPLDRGGMSAGGALHLIRSLAIMVILLACGFIAARLGKRRAMGWSMILTGAGLLTCSGAPAYGWLLPALLVAGCGEGLCEGIGTPFVQDLHRDEPERYVSIAHSFWSVGIGAAVLLAGGLLSLGVSWRAVLGVAGLLSLGSAPLFLWRSRPGHEYPESGRAEPLPEILRKSAAIVRAPRFWVYCLGMFLGAGSEFCLTFWSAAYLQLHFRTAAWAAGLGTGAIALGMFAGRVGFGYFARKAYIKHVLLACGLANIPVTVLLAVLKPEVFASPWTMYGALLVLLVLGGVCIGPYWPMLQVYGAENLKELDTTLLYIYFSAVGVPGCGFFTWLMGAIGDRYGLAGAFFMLPATLAGFCLVVVLEGWVFPRRKPVS